MNITDYLPPISYFDGSLLARVCSRVYRFVVGFFEEFGLVMDIPLVAPYNGSRLYQLVDSFEENNSERFEDSSSNYVKSILVTLPIEESLTKKIEKTKTILQTYILGLSRLIPEKKEILTTYIAYKMIPQLIDEYGKMLRDRSILALDKLQELEPNAPIFQYENLYRDITLQSSEIESIVGSLLQLSDFPSESLRSIIISEIYLARNRYLTKDLHRDIVQILNSQEYIDQKFTSKTNICNQILQDKKISTEERARISELYEPSKMKKDLELQKKAQIEVLQYTCESFFSTLPQAEHKKTRPPSQKKDDVLPRGITNSTQDCWIGSAKGPEKMDLAPVGITNTSRHNCWLISALQVLLHTPIYQDLMKSPKFQMDLPNLFEFMKVYREKKETPQQLGERLEEIQREVFEKFQWKAEINEDNDAEDFITKLLDFIFTSNTEYDNAIVVFYPGRNVVNAAWDKKQKFFNVQKLQGEIPKNPETSPEDVLSEEAQLRQSSSNIVTEFQSIEDVIKLFKSTPYEIVGYIFFINSHYFSAVKIEGAWYLCNDISISQTTEEKLHKSFKNMTTLIITANSFLTSDFGNTET